MKLPLTVCIVLKRSLHMTLRLDDNRLSDLILLGGGAAVRQCSQALTKCSPLLFQTLSIIFILTFQTALYSSFSSQKKKKKNGKESNKFYVSNINQEKSPQHKGKMAIILNLSKKQTKATHKHKSNGCQQHLIDVTLKLPRTTET